MMEENKNEKVFFLKLLFPSLSGWTSSHLDYA